MTDTAELLVDCRCELGEGPLWNPLVQRLFWFDILNCTLLSADASGRLVDRFTFDDYVSAAAVVDKDHLAIAGVGGLTLLDLTTNDRKSLLGLEVDVATNRSNDARVHPSGSFWIGTMGRNAEEDVGALYHVRDGRVRELRRPLTIPNTICFSPDGRLAYFSDTVHSQIYRWQTNPEDGTPIGDPELWLTLSPDDGYPDGAIIDAEGFMWMARWGGGKVVRHAPDGRVVREVKVPTAQVSCPALGGPQGTTLFLTTAREHMTAAQLEADPLAGSLFAIEVDVPGQAEPLFRP